MLVFTVIPLCQGAAAALIQSTPSAEVISAMLQGGPSVHPMTSDRPLRPDRVKEVFADGGFSHFLYAHQDDGGREIGWTLFDDSITGVVETGVATFA